MTDGPKPFVEAALPALQTLRHTVGTPFRVASDAGQPMELTLTEIIENDRGPDWESFSLLFAGAAGTLSQGTQQMAHDRLGSFPLFLVPIADVGGEPLYEAVFNRPTT